MSDTSILLFLIVFASIIYLIFHSLWMNFIERCPRCKKWRARKILSRNVLEKYQTTKTKFYKETVRNKKGEIIKTVSREIPVKVYVEECIYKYTCRYCSHKWTEEKKEEK